MIITNSFLIVVMIYLILQCKQTTEELEELRKCYSTLKECHNALCDVIKDSNEEIKDSIEKINKVL